MSRLLSQNHDHSHIRLPPRRKHSGTESTHVFFYEIIRLGSLARPGRLVYVYSTRSCRVTQACGAMIGHDLGDRSFRGSYNKGGTTQIATAVPKSWTSTLSSRSLLFSQLPPHSRLLFIYSTHSPEPFREGAVVPSTYERLMRVMFRWLGVYIIG